MSDDHDAHHEGLSDASLVVLRPNWNADGRSLIFESKDATGSRLHRMDLDDRVVTPLAACNDGAKRVQGRPAFFGVDDFAFVSDRGGDLSIWRCRLADGRVTRLTNPPPGASDYGPAVLVGADRFLFFRKPPCDEPPRVHVAPLDDPTRATMLTTGMSNQPWPIAGTGDMLFHATRDGAQRILRQSIAPMADAAVVDGDDEGTDFVTPYPSPSGAHVAFARRVDGRPQIFTMRIDGGDRRQLTSDATGALFPCWSPRGDRIAYVRGDPLASVPTGVLCIATIDSGA